MKFPNAHIAVTLAWRKLSHNSKSDFFRPKLAITSAIKIFDTLLYRQFENDRKVYFSFVYIFLTLFSIRIDLKLLLGMVK